MANKKISELSASGALTGAEKVPILQGGVTKQTTTQAIADLSNAAETATTIGALIGSAGDATPNDSDYVATALTGGGILQKITWTNIKAFLKTYFDTIYQTVLVSGTNIKTVNGASVLGSGDLTVTGFTAASVSEINTGTENAKGATPLNLETSKYLTQYSQKTFVVASGTSTYTATLSPAITSQVDGMEIKVRFTSAPTGSSTISFNGLTAKNLYLDSTTQVTSASFPAGYESTLRFVQSLNSGNGGWLLTQFSWWNWLKTQIQTITGAWTFNAATTFNSYLSFTGTVSLPSGDAIYRSAANIINLVIDGVSRLRGTTTGVEVTGQCDISGIAGGSTDRLVSKSTSGRLKDSGLTAFSQILFSTSTQVTDAGNSTLESLTFGSGTGSYTIPASRLFVNRIFEGRIACNLLLDASTNSNLTIYVKYGLSSTPLVSRTVLLSQVYLTTGGATSQLLGITVRVRVLTIGTSGTFLTEFIPSSDNTNFKYSSSVTTIDNTVDNLFTISYAFSSPFAGNKLNTYASSIKITD